MPFQFQRDGHLDQREIDYFKLQAKKVEAQTEIIMHLVIALYILTAIALLLGFVLGIGSVKFTCAWVLQPMLHVISGLNL